MGSLGPCLGRGPWNAGGPEDPTTAPDDREGIPPRPMRPPPRPTWAVGPATSPLMREGPLRPPPRPPPPEDPATLSPVHLVVREEPGLFFTGDPTMPYDNHWGMVQ